MSEDSIIYMSKTIADNIWKDSEGLKYDTGKQKWHSLPLEILEPLADLFHAGQQKYGKFNCLQPFDSADERFYDAAVRHLVACQLAPLAKDSETGCYHAAAVAFNILMRLHHCKYEVESK